MHCRICDRLLTDEEATKKDEETGEFLDTCEECLEDGDEFIADCLSSSLDDYAEFQPKEFD